MTVFPTDPPASTFVVRLWYEGTDNGPRWRGRVEHLQSGERAAFLDVDDLLRFIRRFTALEDGAPPADTRESIGRKEGT